MDNELLMRAIATQIMAYPYKLWGYGEGIALEALLLTGDRLGEPRYQAFVAGLMAQWLEAREDVPYTDHVAPGGALVMLYERTGHPALLTRARALADFFIDLPQTRQGARRHRPDHPDFHHYVYVDCMDFEAPFLCRLARATGETRYFDLAVDCLLGHASVLWDTDQRLFYHMYDAEHDRVNGAFWGRGNGWAALGLLTTLELLPPTHPRYTEVLTLFQAQMARLVELQTADGAWHTVLDRADTYLEGSLPAMFYVALQRGLTLGMLPATYQIAADRAYTAMRARISSDGVLQGVSAASPPGSADHYAAIPTGGAFPWGQGPTLEALLLKAQRQPKG